MARRGKLLYLLLKEFFYWRIWWWKLRSGTFVGISCWKFLFWFYIRSTLRLWRRNHLIRQTVASMARHLRIGHLGGGAGDKAPDLDNRRFCHSLYIKKCPQKSVPQRSGQQNSSPQMSASRRFTSFFDFVVTHFVSDPFLQSQRSKWTIRFRPIRDPPIRSQKTIRCGMGGMGCVSQLRLNLGFSNLGH